MCEIMFKRYDASVNLVFDIPTPPPNYTVETLLFNDECFVVKHFAFIFKIKAAIKPGNNNNVKEKLTSRLKVLFRENLWEITSKLVYPHCLVYIYS